MSDQEINKLLEEAWQLEKRKTELHSLILKELESRSGISSECRMGEYVNEQYEDWDRIITFFNNRPATIGDVMSFLF
jgi:hypothetical protein